MILILEIAFGLVLAHVIIKFWPVFSLLALLFGCFFGVLGVFYVAWLINPIIPSSAIVIGFLLWLIHENGKPNPSERQP